VEHWAFLQYGLPARIVMRGLTKTGFDTYPPPMDAPARSHERVAQAGGNRLRLLLATAETHPTHRPDVRVLFGKYLPESSVDTDLVAVCTEPIDPLSWGGGRLLGRRANSRIGLILADVVPQGSLFRHCFGGYDGLIVRDKPFLGLIGFLAARLARIPFIYWMSFPMTEAWLAIAGTADGSVGWQRRLYTWLRGQAGALVLYRLLAPRADHLFVQSPIMLEHLRAKGVRHPRVSAVPMGVDLDVLPGRSHPRDDTPSQRHVAVYLGTLNKLRRQELETMIDAAKEIEKSFPDFVLLVIGESESAGEKGWLRRYAEARGAARCVRFLGWVPYEEGLRLAGDSSVGISPVPRGPLFDMGSPTKAIEYMALGLPVVCNDQPDQAQVVRESGGGLCVELNPSAFASAVVQLLRDPQRAEEMGKAGRAWVDEHRDYRQLAAEVAQTLRTRCLLQAS